jgi:hypothetical protein
MCNVFPHPTWKVNHPTPEQLSRASGEPRHGGSNRRASEEPQASLAVDLGSDSANGERGRFEVRASIPKISKIRKTERAETAEPQKFSSNFHTDTRSSTRKMWIRSARIVHADRHGPTFVGSARTAVRACNQARAWCPASTKRRCNQNTVYGKAPASFRGLHAKVTNAVLYLASTGAAFVFSESRLMVASCGPGEVEASLAGKAPQSWFGAVSLPAFTRILPVSSAFERPAFCRRAQERSSYRNYRSGMIPPRRRWRRNG